MKIETGGMAPFENKTLAEDAAPQSRELLDAFDEFLGAFEDFKRANDERLAEIERRTAPDVVTEEKVSRINRALDDQKRRIDQLVVADRRPVLSADAREARRGGSREVKAAFESYVRKGDVTGLTRLETKALSAGSDPDGGYLVPEETESAIDRVLKSISPIRAIASVRQIGSMSLKKPTSLGNLGAGWVGETDARPQTTTPTLAIVEFPAMELYAMPAATQSLLDDAYINIDEWLAEEVQYEFAAQEGAAFVTGDGTNKPKGFLAYENVANASYVWGKVGYVATGNAGAFPASDPFDKLVDLVYTPKQAYRQNGRWVMNRKTEAEIRKFKDGDDNYIWQPGSNASEPATLLGYPVSEAEDMPDIGANSFSVAFGDFARGYLIVDRVGVRVLRDPYSAKPYVLFYTTKRVGGGIQNFEAIKLLKFAAS